MVYYMQKSALSSEFTSITCYFAIAINIYESVSPVCQPVKMKFYLPVKLFLYFVKCGRYKNNLRLFYFIFNLRLINKPEKHVRQAMSALE